MPSWLKAALITAAQAFFASAFVTLTGLLGQVQEWLDNGAEPDWSSAAKLLGSALVAAVAGLLTAVHRGLKPPEQTYTEEANMRGPRGGIGL